MKITLTKHEAEACLIDRFKSSFDWESISVEIIAGELPKTDIIHDYKYASLHDVLTSEEWTKVIQVWPRSKKIQLIKFIRSAVNISLLECKTFVERAWVEKQEIPNF